LWAGLTGKPNRLMSFPEVYDLVSCHDLGHCMVEIHRIKGSESRPWSYDAGLRPLKRSEHDRWIRMAVLVSMGAVLPPVDLIQVDKVYYVRDGHNRISTMRALGSKYVDAHVVLMETSTGSVKKAHPVLRSAGITSPCSPG
jgi:hypothetical protein